MNFMHRWLSGFVFLLLAAMATAQTPENAEESRFEERIQSFLQTGEQSPELMTEVWAQVRSGEGDAETDALNRYKLAWAANRWPGEVTEEMEAWLAGKWAEGLALGAASISSRVGAYHFQKSNFEQALAAFQLAESRSTQMRTKAQALENIAVCYVQMDNLDEAIRYFDIAMKLRDGKPNAMTVNNLAGIYNQLGNSTQALTTLALVDWDTEVGPAKRMALINKLSALRNLPDRRDDMASAYTNLIQQFPVPVYPQEVAEIVRAALLLNDTAHVLAIQPEIQAIVDGNAEFASEWMPELAPLFGMEGQNNQAGFEALPWSTQWALARWLVMEREKDRKKADLNERSQALEADLSQALDAFEQSQDRFWMMVALASGLLGLLILTWRKQIQIRRLRREVASGGLASRPAEMHQAIGVIRDAITQGKNINTALVHLSNLNDLLIRPQVHTSLEDAEDDALKVLNDNELALLDQIMRGYSSKEISIIMNVSSGHVYNLRSSVRDKLGLDRGEDLREWLEERYSESPETTLRTRMHSTADNDLK